MGDIFDIYPNNDTFEHDTKGGDCICGPMTKPVECADGGINWLVVHNSLDGRENKEGGGK